MGFVNAHNKVPEYQRMYQAAYKNHTRVWKIHPRSRYMLVPYFALLWSGLGISIWGLGRKAAGYNSYWGDE